MSPRFYKHVMIRGIRFQIGFYPLFDGGFYVTRLFDSYNAFVRVSVGLFDFLVSKDALAMGGSGWLEAPHLNVERSNSDAKGGAR